jgi:hypothetical protein
LDHLAQEDSFGLELDAGCRACYRLESDLVANLASGFHSQFGRHAQGKQACCEPPRLKDHQLTIQSQGAIVE